MRAIELFACNKCGRYPIKKEVETETDELAVEPTCPFCGGETHFEKARSLEED